MPWQVRVVVSDGGSPPKTDTAQLTVEVLRNQFAPKFEPDRYQETVLDTITFSDVVVTVTASDDDVILQPDVSSSSFNSLNCEVDAKAKIFIIHSTDSQCERRLLDGR